MNKKYYLWLQQIANVNCKFNIKEYEKIISTNSNILKNIYYENIENIDMLKELSIEKSIITTILDKNIKNSIDKMYNKIIENNLEITTIEDSNYPRKLFECNEDIPFYYISNSRINLNNKNIYIYFNNYYTKFARNLVEYFAKIINEEKVNVLTEFNSEKINKIEIVYTKILNYKDWYKNIDYIILPSEKYIKNFKNNIIDILILIEARYEKDIVSIVDELLEIGKDIYVVPANIFRKNSYFSNYLIKQGANIILNKWDIKFIARSIIS